MWTNPNFSFSVRWRNNMIIHWFLLVKKALNIFEKWVWLWGCRSIQLSPIRLTPRRNSKDWLASQPIQICYKRTKKRLFTQSRFAKKRTLEQKILLKKVQTHKKLNFDKNPMLRFYEKHILASKLFLFNKETQLEIFFESVFRKSKCDCRFLHFWHNCCFLK